VDVGHRATNEIAGDIRREWSFVLGIDIVEAIFVLDLYYNNYVKIEKYLPLAA
jgi:hypothetical protein